MEGERHILTYYTLKCPYCKADLEEYDDLNTFYCKYCGGKIIIDDRNSEVIHERVMDHAARRVSRQKNEEIEREFRRKDKELAHQKKVNDYKDKIFYKLCRDLALLFIVFAIVMEALIYFGDKSEQKTNEKLTGIFLEIQNYINNGQYDEALLLLPDLHGTEEWNKKHDELELIIKQAYINNMENKYVNIGKSAKSFEKTNYEDVITYFENLGFIYVNTFSTNTSKFWFPKDNQVETVAINGNNDFNSEEEFPLDAKVTITYYRKESKES